MCPRAPIAVPWPISGLGIFERQRENLEDLEILGQILSLVISFWSSAFGRLVFPLEIYDFQSLRQFTRVLFSPLGITIYSL
jgi:hypothetical protein